MKTLKLSLFTVLIFLFSYSCRKADIPAAEQTNDPTVETFLRLPADADPLLIRIVRELRKQNDRLPFIQKLAAAVGTPRWDFSEMKLPARSTKSYTVQLNSVASAESGNAQTVSDTTVFVPCAFEGAGRVNSFLAVHLSGSIRTDLFMAKDYQSFGYERVGISRPQLI